MCTEKDFSDFSLINRALPEKILKLPFTVGESGNFKYLN